MTSSLETPPLWAELSGARRVLIAGAGGGFDVYAGLPIALRLSEMGKAVQLANLTFSDLSEVPAASWRSPELVHIEPNTPGRADYFAERTLVRWLRSEGYDWEVCAITRAGVEPVARAYRQLVEDFDADALVLVDGGNDILLRGDESGLGTPEEDSVSLVAASLLDLPIKVVASLGFGVDAHHGVSSVDVLSRLADLMREGAYLGALSIPADSPEALAYVDAVEHAALHNSARPSIVNGQIVAALGGNHGHGELPGFPTAADLFVNPLMAIYFSVRLNALAKNLLYRDLILSTITIDEVSRAIETFRSSIALQARRPYPH